MTAEDPGSSAASDGEFVVVRHMDRPAITRFVHQQAETYAELWRINLWRR